MFEQWHENISLKCFLQTTVKLPEWCLGGSKSKGLDKDILETDQDDLKLIDFNISKRVRDPEKFIESESPFTSQFQLSNEFTSKYEYFMTGKVAEIQFEVQQLRDRLDRYMSKFPTRFAENSDTH